MDVLQSTLATLWGLTGTTALWIGLLYVTLKKEAYLKQTMMIQTTLGVVYGAILSGTWFTWLYLDGIDKETAVALLCAFQH